LPRSILRGACSLHFLQTSEKVGGTPQAATAIQLMKICLVAADRVLHGSFVGLAQQTGLNRCGICWIERREGHSIGHDALLSLVMYQ
jgi:hypothetical protein